MKKIDRKNYKSDEGIIVIHHTIDALYQKYYSTIPKQIEKMIVDLILETADLLNNSKTGIKN